MKKTAKTLLGVLSVGALVGTGYAMWHISGGFVGTESELTPGIETEVDKNFGYIEVTPLDGDNTINFDGVADEDLTVKYTVKAFANSGSTRDPYDLTNYDGIAEEYIPNLKITTIAKDDSGELSSEDDFYKYVKLPETQIIDYKTWLDSTCKVSGYAVALTFSWSDELGNQNPEIAWKGLTVEEQEANYDALIAALNGVKFTFKFEVGNEVTPPSLDETGEITIPTVEGSTFSIEGMSNGKVTAGDHEITLEVTGDNQLLNNNELTIYKKVGDKTTEETIELDESNGRAIGRVYAKTYTFEKDATYTFDYKIATTMFFKDLNGLNYMGSKAYVYAWNDETNNGDFPGQEITFVSYDAAMDGANLYTFNLVTSDYDNIILSTGTLDKETGIFDKKSQTVDISLTNFDSSLNLYALTGEKDGENYVGEFVDYDKYYDSVALVSVKYNEEQGNITYDRKLYMAGDQVTISITPYDNYEIDQVLLNSETPLTVENQVVTFEAVKGDNVVEVTFKEKEVAKKGVVTTSATNCIYNLYYESGEEYVEGTEVNEGTILKLSVTPNDFYKLTTVSYNGTDLTEEEGLYTINVVEGTNEVTIKTELNVSTIDEAINQVDSTIVSVAGTVHAISEKDGMAVISDGTNYIYCYQYVGIIDDGININDVVAVKGEKTTYNGIIEIKVSEISKLEGIDPVTLPTNPVIVDKDYLESSDIGAKHEFVKGMGVCTKNGEFVNLFIEGTEKQIGISNTEIYTDGFVDGKAYEFEGYIKNFAGDNYLNIYATKVNVKELAPESIDLNGVDTYDIETGETISLSYEVKPFGASQDVNVEIIEGGDLVTVENGEITAGDVAGTVTLKLATIGDNPIYSDVITLNIIASTTVSYGKINFGELNDSIDTDGYVNSSLNAEGLIEYLKEKTDNQEMIDEENSKLVEPSAVYKPSSGNPGLKMGKSGDAGSFTLALNETVKKVEIKFAVWDTSRNYLSINDQSKTITEAKNSVVTYTFDDINSNVLKITSGKRIVILNIALYK